MHTDPGDKVAQLVDYMYEPVASTLLAAAQPFFRVRNASLDVRTIGPEAMVNTSYWFADALKLCHGSVFVWLGIYLSNTVPWERLHKLGVRIIYYQTEVLVAESVDPKVRCLLPSPLVDEVWDFSWHNIDFCRSGPRAPKLRYVPFVSREQTDFALAGRIPPAIKDGSLEKRAGLAMNSTDTHIMLCGNPAMLKDVQAVLADRGFKRNRRKDPGQITTENYW